MAIAHDAVFKGTAANGETGPARKTWNHTASGSAIGVAVFAYANSTGAAVATVLSSAYYGGVKLVKIAGITYTSASGAESCQAIEVWSTTAGLSPGVQVTDVTTPTSASHGYISVTVAGTVSPARIVAYATTAVASAVNPHQTLTTNADTMAYAAVAHDSNSVLTVMTTNCTNAITGFDWGSQVADLARRTDVTPPGTFDTGYGQAADHWAAAGIAFAQPPDPENGSGIAKGCGTGILTVPKVTVDAASNGGTGTNGTTGFTWNHAVGADATLLIVAVGNGNDASVSSVTAGGTPMNTSAADSKWKRHGGDGSAGYGQVFTLAGPPTGTVAIVVTWTGGGSTTVSGCSLSLNGTPETEVSAYTADASAAGTANVITNGNFGSPPLSSLLVMPFAFGGQGSDSFTATAPAELQCHQYNSASGAGTSGIATVQGGGPSSIEVTGGGTGDSYAAFAFEVLVAPSGPQTYARAGGGIARGAGGGSASRAVRSLAGGGISRGAGTAARQVIRSRTGGGMSVSAGQGQRSRVLSRYGAASTIAMGTGVRVRLIVRPGGGMVLGLGIAPRAPTVRQRTGSASATAAGVGTEAVQGAQQVFQRDGAGLAAAVGTGSKEGGPLGYPTVYAASYAVIGG